MASELEQQLCHLRLQQDNSKYADSPTKKKVAPAVPPKPKKLAQPQVPVVPKSYSVQGPTEPSYSTVLQNSSPTHTPVYSNVTGPFDSNAAETSSNRSNYSAISDYSNIANYSNISNYGSNYGNMSHYSDLDILNNAPSVSASCVGVDEEEDLPPPPPPEEYHQSFPPPPHEELPPPPSPVSSSYSELRRATNNLGLASYDNHHGPYDNQHGPFATGNYGQNYDTYGPSSQNSSTYESIYEPINPRPSSQMSSQSNYSLYNPYVSPKAKGLAPAPTNQPLTNPDKYGKEAEVDALTNLLVQSMEGADTDFFGICSKCGEKVVGEGAGCSAMGQVYHITCFTCYVCQIQLQGKPFYTLDGKPYCEEDYLNTLEKCCVCAKPILDRILRATGKPYHPQCFTCVMCGKSLDGIPFTVDATNQIHCIDDFHKKFAPRCCVCKLPILPESGQEETVRVVALDKSFHVSCYKCEDCGLILSTEAEGRGCFPLDDHVLCKSCNAKRVQALTSRMTTEL